MLEGVFVVTDIVIIVVGIGEEGVAGGKDICRAYIGCGEMSLARVFDFIDFLGIIVEVLTQLIAQVGIGVAVTDNLHGAVGSDGAVVGGEYYGVVALRQEFEEFGEHGVTEP